MKSVEMVGKNKEEAVEKALADLGLKRNQVNVEVMDEGNRGFLGFMGSRPVRVRVQELGEGDQAPVAVVQALLEMMDVEFQLEVSQDEESTQIRVLSEKDDGLLIGRRGQTLDALRHLAQRIIAARLGRNVVVNIDIGDYRARREEGLRERALEAAEEALKSKRSVSLEPMSAQDRRVVHLELAERGDIHTYTVGSGARRRVVVSHEARGRGDSQEWRGRPRRDDRRGERQDDRRGERHSERRDDRRNERQEVRREERQDVRREERRPERSPQEEIPRESTPPQLETAYDTVPDPGFRPTRLSDGEVPRPPAPREGGSGRGRRRGRGSRAARPQEGDAAPRDKERAAAAASPQSGEQHRVESRDSKPDTGRGGPREDRPPRGEGDRFGGQDRRPRRDESRSSREEGRSRDDGRPRDERGRREGGPRAENRAREDGRPRAETREREDRRPPREESRAPREERHRDRPARDDREFRRDRDPARDEFAKSAGGNEVVELEVAPTVTDDSEKKPFSSDLAKQVLQFGKDNGRSSGATGGAGSRRRSRRR